MISPQVALNAILESVQQLEMEPVALAERVEYCTIMRTDGET